MNPTIIETGPSTGTMLLWAACVSAATALLGVAVKAISSWLNRKKTAWDLQEQADRFAFEKREREEKERIATEERQVILQHLEETKNQLKAVSEAQEKAMAVRADQGAKIDDLKAQITQATQDSK